MKKTTTVFSVIFLILVFFSIAQLDSISSTKNIYDYKTEKFCDEKKCTYENVTVFKKTLSTNYDYIEPLYSRVDSKSNIVGMVKSKELQCRDYWVCLNNTKINSSTGCKKEYSCKTVLVYKYDTVNITSIEQ